MHEQGCRALFESQIAGLTEEVCQLRGWQIFSREYPVLDVGFRSKTSREIRIRMRCNGYDDLPASIELLTIKGDFLAEVQRDPAGVFNSSSHPVTGRPFICMRGAREYHQHESHVADLWDNIKRQPGYDLGGVLTQVWRAWSRIT